MSLLYEKYAVPLDVFQLYINYIVSQIVSASFLRLCRAMISLKLFNNHNENALKLKRNTLTLKADFSYESKYL